MVAKFDLELEQMDVKIAFFMESWKRLSTCDNLKDMKQKARKIMPVS